MQGNYTQFHYDMHHETEKMALRIVLKIENPKPV